MLLRRKAAMREIHNAQYKDSITDNIKVAYRSHPPRASAERSAQKANLVNNLLALLPRHVLIIHVQLCRLRMGMILAISLDILDHLSQTKQVIHALQ
jgi:hypothetical protein